MPENQKSTLHADLLGRGTGVNLNHQLITLGGPLVSSSGSPSVTREIRSEFSFLNEHVTFRQFIIDLLSVLNVFQCFSVSCEQSKIGFC